MIAIDNNLDICKKLNDEEIVKTISGENPEEMFREMTLGRMM